MADKMTGIEIIDLVEGIVRRLSDREAATRNAFQRIDDITKLIGMKYRPEWAQPLQDDWQQTMRDLAALRALINGWR